MTNLTHNSFLCIYFNSLHVSSNLALIIRRISCINTTSGIQGVFKKRPNFCYKDFILQHFKHCPLQSSPLCWRYTVPNVSSIVGMLPGTHFSDGAQFSYRIFMNLRVFKKRPNFLISTPTSTRTSCSAE
jgi:hypothetical protein